ncbi:MAG: hypothetical protein BBJ60_04815 [Desulfobacterales bacterium S7086C20]|nr:MAG: hypothetical protein BBJ60_04815 [Desulfobacterales bacterium S7086C20]
METFDDELTTSLQIARRAIPKMTQRKVPPTPDNYRVWYEYCIGCNEQLAEKINKLISSDNVFTPELNQEIHKKYFGKDKEKKLVEEVQRQASKILKTILDDILSTNDLAADYANKLKDYSSTLDDASHLSQIQDIVQDMIKDTNQMAESTVRMKENFQKATTDAENLREQLNITAREALIDALTGLNNRKAFDKRLRELHGAFEEDKTPFSVIMLDIDFFKKFNDKYGHKIGDEVLQFVGSLLYNTLKGRDFPARYGGEEFVILLPATVLDNACIVAEEIRRRMSEKRLKHVRTGEGLGRITASFGVAEIALDDTIDSLLERADKALYLAKDSGRNNVKSEKDVKPKGTD